MTREQQMQQRRRKVSASTSSSMSASTLSDTTQSSTAHTRQSPALVNRSAAAAQPALPPTPQTAPPLARLATDGLPYGVPSSSEEVEVAPGWHVNAYRYATHDGQTFVRDSVTGAAIPVAQLSAASAAARLVVRDTDRTRRAPLRLPNGQIIPGEAIPLRIDTAQPFPGGSLGGKRWSAQFAKYIAPVLPADVLDALRQWHEWWTIPYVVGRLRSYESKEAGYVLSRGAVDALLKWKRDGMTYYDVWRSQRAHSYEWLGRQYRAAQHIVRQKYLGYEARREGVLSWAE